MLEDLITAVLTDWGYGVDIKIQSCQLLNEDVPEERRLQCRFQSGGIENIKTLKIRTGLQFEKGCVQSSLARLEHCKKTKTETELAQAIQNTMSIITSSKIIGQSTAFELDGSVVYIEEDLAADRFKEGTETDPRGFVFGKCAEIIKVLASFHASSVLVLKENAAKPWASDKGLTLLDDVLSSEVIQKLNQKLSDNDGRMPDVVNICDFRTSNIVLRYTGCGTWDVRFKCIASEVTSPLMDLVHFFALCPEPEDKNRILEDLLEIYSKRFSEVSSLLQLPLSCSLDRLQSDVRNLVG